DPFREARARLRQIRQGRLDALRELLLELRHDLQTLSGDRLPLRLQRLEQIAQRCLQGFALFPPGLLRVVERRAERCEDAFLVRIGGDGASGLELLRTLQHAFEAQEIGGARILKRGEARDERLLDSGLQPGEKPRIVPDGLEVDLWKIPARSLAHRVDEDVDLAAAQLAFDVVDDLGLEGEQVPWESDA